MKLGVWLKAAVVTMVVIAIVSRVAPVRKIVFNEQG
jgi:hypothetical protein